MYDGAASDVTNVMIRDLQQVPDSKDSSFHCSNVTQTDFSGNFIINRRTAH